ncbi:Rap1-interacting factor 1 N terminal-domain-containing protein [Rhexocercosporidium sp. MPI-PUGE-AT-0058]|nr:Rap1-interacting factor 1 N terminal-domain-containing protein [Rhexocercosporidium sp. MPI-PUGE-AT-0058]
MVESAAASNPPPSPTVQARPPTPPRESSHNESKLGKVKESKPSLLGDISRFFKADPNYRRASAPATSTSAVESPVQAPGSGSGTGKKKVGWSESTDYSEPPTASYDGQDIRRTVQPLAPSSERKPSKSILKISSNGGNEQDLINGVNSKLLPPHHHATFATMLDSIVQQLGGKDRTSKMDAYLMFSGLLKASDNIPDMKALKSKMGLLCQFVTQDLSEKLENGKSDTGLVVNALVLLSSFLQRPAIAEMFPADFPVQVVEHAIKSFEDPSASKEIIKHLMFVMAQQNFSTKVMTQERVCRLILALHGIEDHIKGKSINLSRINILRTLLRSSKGHMMANTIWFTDLFNDMLSSLREIRTAAIAFGFEAAVTLGAESNATRTVSNLFKLVTKERYFADFYADSLKGMVKNKKECDGAAVPQIWSIIILFFRSNPQALIQWKFLGTFLEVIQLCFNSSDTTTKMEANLAWNRLIFAIQLNEKTPPKFRAIVSNVLFTQLKSRKSSTGRKACLGSIHILLYYTLKPQSTSAQLELYWDEYVVPVIKGCLASAKARGDPTLAKQDAVEACAILQSLFDSKTPRKWYESRAIDSLQQTPMVPAELPALDPKWLRRNHVRMFKVLNPLMELLYWDLGNDSEISRLWKTFISSIGSPAVGEVIINPDTMSSIASMFSMLHRIWLTGGEKLASLMPSDAISTGQRTIAFTRSFENIVLTAASLDGLQLTPFTDKLLGIAQNTFVAVATPSQVLGKHRVETRSPLYHLILLLTTPSPGLEYDRQFYRMVDRILSPFMTARTSKAQLKLVYSLAHLLPSESNDPSRVIWQVLAEFATTAVDTRDSNEHSGDEVLGTKYLNIVKILEIGVSLYPSGPFPAWRHLFDALVSSATLDAGDAGRAIGVIEPLAKIFTPQVPSVILSSKGMLYLSLVLGKSNYPKDRQALDSAHRKLSGTGNHNQRSASFDPYVHLYQYTSATLTGTYGSFTKENLHEYSDVISTFTGLLGRCPTSLLLPVLTRFQSGIEPWILDNDQKLPGGDVLSKSVASLWAMVKKLIPRLFGQYDRTTILRDLEPLICAGLNSKHATLVNGTITFWNTFFGSCEETFEYPESLKEALLRLRAIADVQVPYLPESLEEEPSADQRQPIDFMETQDDSYGFSSFPNDSIMRLMRQSTPQVIIESRRNMSLKRSRDNTPESSGRKSRKRDVTPRIRHDDSQVQFEAVESSPMADRVLDSQLLTDKQKETKERQQAEQSMFPDLGSTPNPREKSARKPEEAEMELPTRQSSQLRTKPSDERQTTPNLPIPSDDDGYVASSPTPTRSIRGEPDVRAESDPPSSPPVAPKRKTAYVESSSPSLEHTPEPAIETATAVAELKQIDEDVPSSPPDSTPEPRDVMDLDGGQVEEEVEVPAEINGSFDNMDLDPATEIDEEKFELPGHVELSNEDMSKPEPTNETTSFGPSAQVDSLQNLTMSAFEFAPEVRHSSPLDEDPSEQLRVSQMEEHLKSSIEDDVEDGVPPTTILSREEPKEELDDQLYHESQQFPMFPILDPLPPATPVRHVASSPIGQKTPQFVDAPFSPASSDRQDVFEDAVSSPHSNRGKENAPSNPSTPDYYATADVSSFLRAVNQCDRSSHAGKEPFVDDGPISSRRKTRASASKELERTPIIDSSPIRKLAWRKTSNLLTIDKEPASSTSVAKSSSVPSLIPETPGMNPTGNPAERIVDEDGQEFDPVDTIVVDTSSLAHYRPGVKRGRKKGKKRKLSETGGDSNEIPDSQDAIARSETSSPRKQSPAKRSPAKKKTRGRPLRASQVSQEASDLESGRDGRSQSLSVDLDAPRQEMEIDDTTMSIASNGEEEEGAPAKEPAVGQSFEGSSVRQGAAEFEIEQSIAKCAGEDEDAAVTDEATSSNVDFVDETRIDETSLFDTSPVEPENDIDEEVISRHSAELPVAGPPVREADAEPVEQVEPEVPFEPAVMPELEVIPTAPEPQRVTMQSMKDKLQSLLSDLETSALSRQEVHEMEDIFMDVKRKLYDAEKRGRASMDA